MMRLTLSQLLHSVPLLTFTPIAVQDDAFHTISTIAVQDDATHTISLDVLLHSVLLQVDTEGGSIVLSNDSYMV